MFGEELAAYEYLFKKRRSRNMNTPADVRMTIPSDLDTVRFDDNVNARNTGLRLGNT